MIRARRLTLAPRSDLLQDRLTATTGTIRRPGAEAVLSVYFVIGDQKLKVPGRIARLLRRVDTSARRRMRESEDAATVEHEDRRHVAELAVVERLIEIERRQMSVQRRRIALGKPQVDPVGGVPNRALVVVLLGAELLPETVVTEVHALVGRGVDITRPEQRDGPIAEDMLPGPAAKLHVHIMRRDQAKSCPAF